jgi:SAM-dependent methyltransferase
VNIDPIQEAVAEYYSGKVQAHGATHKGVDWNSVESQQLRFQQILKVCDTTTAFSINDYGCGYGALIEELERSGVPFDYCGFDISEAMLASARSLHGTRANCTFISDASLLEEADYTVASGIFNVRLKTPMEEWLSYILDTLHRMNAKSRKGLAFNALTSYSDAEYMREDLYYADPCRLFDYCKRHFSRDVALLHDYTLYEFTILVRKM